MAPDYFENRFSLRRVSPFFNDIIVLLNMNEKKPWLRVVGGTEHAPKIDDDYIPHIEDSADTTPNQLLVLFTQVVSRMPVDFNQSINAELLKRYQLIVKSYTCGQLYNYLSNLDIWIHPTFTRACLDEVLVRKDASNYSPRDI